MTEATAVGLRWTTIVRVGTELLLLVSMIVLARLIPPGAFGMFAIAIIVQELAVSVPSEGVGTAIVQRRSVDREHLQAGLALSLMVGAGLVVGTLLAAVFIVDPLFGHETALVVAATTPWFILGAILALPMTVLRRRLDFRLLSLLGLAQSVVRAVTSILLAAVFGLDAWALVFGGLAGMCAMVVLALAFARVPLPRWRGSAVRDLLPYGGPAMIACFSWAGFRNGDYAIVGARLGAVPAGIYWRGFSLAVDYQTKISSVMTEVALPVLARTAGADEMFALRKRMVQLLTVVVFPLLTSLVLLAPTVVPWVFGPNWEPAVLPTQILAGAGAASVVINAAGTVLMASGRARAMLGYGVAHFAVYVGAVLVASTHGLAAVCVAAVSVHGAFVVVAYRVLLHGRSERTLRLLWDDVAPASVACVALVAAGLPVSLALGGTGVAPIIHVVAVGSAGAIGYLAALRTWFPDAWRDLAALFRRVLPTRPLRAVTRRMRRSRTGPLQVDRGAPRSSNERVDSSVRRAAPSCSATTDLEPREDKRSHMRDLGRVLVTGGAGAIGSNVTDELVLAGAEEIVVLDNLVRGRRESLAWAEANGPVTFVDGDICDRGLVRELMEGVDVVFHLAAIRITQCAEEPRLALEVLVDGTYNVFEAAVDAGVRKVVASSSASVYGLAEEFPTTERHHPYANDTLYGAAKAFNEGLLRSLHNMSGLDYVALRYFNVYGPRMDVHGVYTEVLVRWMERISSGQPPLILGDGSQTMDFVYIGDVARANLLAAQADVTDSVYNIASGTETSLLALAEMLLCVMGANSSVEHGPARAVNGVTRRLADTRLARDELGFEAEVDLEEGLTRLVEWWQAEQAGTPAEPVRSLARSS